MTESLPPTPFTSDSKQFRLHPPAFTSFQLPFYAFPTLTFRGGVMGSVRDFLRGVGILSSAGITVSNAGTRLLNLRNDLNRLAIKGAPANEKPMVNSDRNWPALERGRSPSSNLIVEERLVGYGREAVAAVGKRAPARAAVGSETALERKRRLARESMRRLRAKRKATARKTAKKKR